MEQDKVMIEEMVNVQANNKNIADALTQKTGKTFKSQDVRNIKTRLKEAKNVETIEEILAKIKAAGGEVKYKKAEGTNDVQTLFIQTVTMKKNLARNKPTLFESDTTFGNNTKTYTFVTFRYFRLSTRHFFHFSFLFDKLGFPFFPD